MSVDLYLMNEKGVCRDFNREPCIMENPETYFAREGSESLFFNMTVEFKISVEQLKGRGPQFLQSYYLIAIYDIEDEDDTEDDYGWMAHKVFDENGNLLVGEFTEPVLQLPVKEIPFDFSTIPRREDGVQQKFQV